MSMDFPENRPIPHIVFFELTFLNFFLAPIYDHYNTTCCWFAMIFNDFQWFDLIRFDPLRSALIRFQIEWFASIRVDSILIDFHWFLLIFIDFVFIFIDFHWFSMILYSLIKKTKHQNINRINHNRSTTCYIRVIVDRGQEKVQKC